MLELQPDSLFETRFRIVRKLGEGGFGVVYEAEDVPLRRSVAIKILKCDIAADTEARRRFLREGKILSALSSDKLVRLYSVNISSAGLLYMVMELLNGRTLRAKLLETGSLSEEDSIKIARAITASLSVLEQNGVVHRDLKPDNIMVLDARNQTIKLLDFGLSGLLSTNKIADTSLTGDGAMIGSIHYMAPEVCLGEKGTITSDFYALGCILYECLTGRPPFDDIEPTAVIFKHVNEMPIDPTLQRKSLRKTTVEILQRLLQKDPAARFDSCSEVEHALDNEGFELKTTSIHLAPFTGQPPAPGVLVRRNSIFAVTVIAAIAIIYVCIGSRTRYNQIEASPGNSKLCALATTLTLEIKETGRSENADLLPGETKRREPGIETESKQKLKQLFEILTMPQTGAENHYLQPQTITALVDLAAALCSRGQKKRAIDLCRETLVFIADDRNTSARAKHSVIDLLVSMADDEDLQQKDYEAIRAPILKSLKGETFSLQRVGALLALSIANTKVRDCTPEDTELDKLIGEAAEELPASSLLNLRPTIHYILAWRLQHGLTKGAENYARVLMRIDKENPNSRDVLLLLARDYIELSQALRTRFPIEAKRHVDSALLIYTTYGITNLDRVLALNVDARLKVDAGKRAEARAILQKAERLTTELPLKERREAVFELYCTWREIHVPHEELDPQCSDGLKVIQLASKLNPTDGNIDAIARNKLNCAGALINHASVEKTITELQRSLDFANNTKGVSPDCRYLILRVLCRFLLDKRHFRESLPYYDRIFSAAEFATLSKQDQQQMLWEAGNAQFAVGMYEEAIATWKKTEGWRDSKILVSMIEQAQQAEAVAKKKVCTEVHPKP
ncbi:MAG: serine/threonine protein kinase [Candidatus Obscuribacterales bacterium]|nr:serine/threonine protein kinase [Candidatus Obscuribacterales bacterium]